MAQQLKGLAALAEHPGLAPSTHFVAHRRLKLQSRGAKYPLQPLQVLDTEYTYAHLSKTIMHIKVNKIFY